MKESILYNKMGQWTLKKNSDPSQYKTPKKFTKVEMVAAIRQDIIAELDAINLYEAQFNAIDDAELKKTIRHIIDEEKHHVEELEDFLKKVDIPIENKQSHD
jgi:uncharacterized protein